MIDSLNTAPSPIQRHDNDDVFECFGRALRRRHGLMWPYAHAFLERLFPEHVIRDLIRLPWAALPVGEISGRRELHNDQRRFFDTVAACDIGVVCDLVEAFQGRSMIRLLRNELGLDLSGTFLRMEYCQDVDGFWLEPHTDIGVKRLTMQCYLSAELDQLDLGTDIYADPATRVSRAPFGKNKAMLFVPNDHTWHGFERRPIRGVRKSLIINYVTNAWRAREQLAFPDEPVSAL